MVVEIKRPSGRKHNEKRAVSVEIGTSKYAEGSCLIRFGIHMFFVRRALKSVSPIFERPGYGLDYR